MARRAHKRHVQLGFARLERKRDKNGQWRGGARRGAGRPSFKKLGLRRRASERHLARPELSARHPVHVVLRACKEVGSLRTHAVFGAIREATIQVYKHEETFRIVHFSIQKSHIHLLVEANDKDALSMGMKAFGISAAKHINTLVSAARGARERRRGSVFTDRYHATVLTNPKQVRHCISYVLNNWRHHRADRDRLKRPWKLDPYASGLSFDGWKERENLLYFETPSGYFGPLVAWPRTYFLSTGWRRYGLISIDEVAGGEDD